MSLPLSEENIAQLNTFAQLCIKNPAILHKPEFSCVKSVIEHFGGKIPVIEDNDTAETKFEAESDTKKPDLEPEPESEESDLELDMTGVIEPDTDAPQQMGDPTLEPTEEQIAESQAKRTEAISAFMEQDYEKALELYTEAVLLNPQASLLYAKRGQVYLLLNKPNACIRDCNHALELNPDSAAGHKFRGRAYQLLGKWEEAANDLRLACKFDFDEQADEWLREVTPNARKIAEHKRKKERRQQEKSEHERQEKVKKAREGVKTDDEATDEKPPGQPDSSPLPPGMDFMQFVNDADVRQALGDPEIEEALKEISANPANILKYQSNPKIMAFVYKMASKILGPDGTPGGNFNMMGGMPGFAGAGETVTNAAKTKVQDNVGLD